MFKMKSTSLVPRASLRVSLIAGAPAMTKSFAAGPGAPRELQHIGALWLRNHVDLQRGSIALLNK